MIWIHGRPSTWVVQLFLERIALLSTQGVPQIGPLSQAPEIKYLEDVWYYPVVPRREDNETEFIFYRYGFAYLVGLPDTLCTRQAAPLFKI